MKILVREISGRQSKQRYAEVTVDYFGNKLDLGVHSIQERKELADHLKEVIEYLLWELPNDPTTAIIQNG
jgi:hypothetical protein